MDTKLLDVIKINKSFGKNKVLDDLTFSLDEGEILVLVGENGAGKSTLLAILATIIKSDSGDVMLKGKSIIKRPSMARGQIAYLPQETTLYDNLNTADNLRFWASMGGMPKNEQKEKIPQVIEELRLGEFGKQKVGKLSVGQRKKINIATVLLSGAKILLMDEPTAGLDDESRDEIIKIVNDLKAEGISIIYVTHVNSEVELLADKVLHI